MNNVMTTVIITNAQANRMRALSKHLGDQYDNMFTTGLSASGELPATHWISSGLVPDEYLALLKMPPEARTEAIKRAKSKGNTYTDTQTQVNTAIAAAIIHEGTRIRKRVNLTTGLETTEDIVVPEGPHELIARLDLKIINPKIV